METYFGDEAMKGEMINSCFLLFIFEQILQYMSNHDDNIIRTIKEANTCIQSK